MKYPWGIGLGVRQISIDIRSSITYGNYDKLGCLPAPALAATSACHPVWGHDLNLTLPPAAVIGFGLYRTITELLLFPSHLETRL
jgi:hypothetical protein